ncbi:phosphatase PAP2 family protein [uncultured Faecalibaculum sp.]|uniref:phosphatase PAP2 family protein n=1 Tax=uncultured Faecalibaculum sp. TaxID=1729681 RepID=UPI002621AAF5|nr:phosphatase PAP2 family protein [uncultured Faecalibaculum sp.]
MNGRILLWFQTLRTPELNQIVLLLTNTIWLAAALLLVLLLFCRTRTLGWRLIAGLALTLILSTALKHFVQEPRPFLVVPGLERVGPVPGGTSFPSSHTAAAFALFWGLLFAKDRWWIAAFLYAVLIALTRLYLGVHYPTDLAGGILVSLLCCGVTAWVFHRLKQKGTIHDESHN